MLFSVITLSLDLQKASLLRLGPLSKHSPEEVNRRKMPLKPLSEQSSLGTPMHTGPPSNQYNLAQAEVAKL